MRVTSLALAAFFGLGACTTPAATVPEAPQEVTAAAVVEAPPMGVATDATKSANAALAARLPLGDQSDFEDANHGLLAQITEDITDADGNVVWSIKAHDFIKGEAPDTVNPSLWRQESLNAIHGLFEVTDGVYQVRGYDLATMSVIRGKTGWIIVDPLLSKETAAAALKLVNDTLGERPVTGVIYTHSHADHFGGARGVIDEADAAARKVPILAPIGFTESAISENLLAGNYMSRRAVLMFGNSLPDGPTAQVGVGLGAGLSKGTLGFIPPTEEISGRGTKRVVDGVNFEFIDAANTEAPAEFMFYLPDFRVLCTAEVATATFHNGLTLRGAKVRDFLEWSRVLDYALVNYAGRSDIAMGSHHWPTFGRERVQDFLRGQRDVYRYTHDQTVRLANRGDTQFEIAEELQEPSIESKNFDTRGYYGTLNHNAKAVYQFYFGWWDGVPATYNAWPMPEHAPRFVELAGGEDAALKAGIKAFEGGDYRWSAEIFNNIVFTNPENQAARDWLASSYEQMGFQAESGAWRDYYLTGAAELRRGLPDEGQIRAGGSADFIKGVPTVELFNALAVRYDPSKMARDPFTINFVFPDTGETLALDVGDSITFPRPGVTGGAPAATLTLNRSAFNQLILRTRTFQDLAEAGEAKLEGDPTALGAWFGALETPPFWFHIVEP
ncbi:MAG TPA: alkyl sulfatase dimerization domain-containing protein [Hyphomonas sp.]|nr:MBL fold metallo-hydrolase [Hyphomonas sp.]MCA8904859.1 MBL fold metallo-hydrolase [Hyphomonas sp.]HPE48483.1 alkyl sulfatase dimerization domain-containing protein [Hyphomonas sp.]